MDQEGTAGETASGNPVEVLVECVFGNKVLISLKVFLFLFIIMWSSGDGNSTKEPGIDPGLTEKPDPTTEEPEPTTGSTSQGEKGAYKRASLSVCILGVTCGGDRGHAATCDSCVCFMQDNGMLSCGPSSDCGGDCQWKSVGSGSICIRKPGKNSQSIK